MGGITLDLEIVVENKLYVGMLPNKIESMATRHGLE